MEQEILSGIIKIKQRGATGSQYPPRQLVVSKFGKSTNKPPSQSTVSFKSQTQIQEFYEKCDSITVVFLIIIQKIQISYYLKKSLDNPAWKQNENFYKRNNGDIINNRITKKGKNEHTSTKSAYFWTNMRSASRQSDISRILLVFRYLKHFSVLIIVCSSSPT